MRALRRAAVVSAVLVCGACAGSPAPRPVTPAFDDDSTGTVWGDEHEGLRVDDARSSPASRSGLRAEWVEGDARSARADAAFAGWNASARRAPSGDVKTISWHGTAWLREVTAGDVSPSIAEGALAGDPRTGGDLRAPRSARAPGLQLRPSPSSWAAVTGAGAVVTARGARVALGGWRSREDVTRVVCASAEVPASGGVIGLAYAGAFASHPTRHAASLYASRDDGAAFMSGEVAISAGRVRAVARAVAGARREWSAVAIAGAGPAQKDRLDFSSRERWGAALERRDRWAGGASTAGVSSLTRRDAGASVRRRRAFFDVTWRVHDEALLDLAARVTREESDRAEGGVLVAGPERARADDWRARVTLRTREAGAGAWIIDNAYRLEWVQNRSGRPGTIATWTSALQRGGFDVRLAASAYALHRSQVTYSAETALPGSRGYEAVSGRGAALSASVHVAIAGRARLGAAWSKRPPGESRVWVSLAVRT